MTVRELIEVLRGLPLDFPVTVMNDDGDEHELQAEGVWDSPSDKPKAVNIG